ncbi:DUF2799 domain-containing protein [Neptuniibacter marinus]|uniref:DUF2799 domain-containing protein n=1 Tax=Neptuniibacter marinus TaxID=1806670 RepID=UPI00082C32A5|nr:DUF2799 domain-containing protein [Neptuniibacter marinus]
MEAKRSSKSVVLISLVALLSGCASLSEEECVTGDWYGIGYSDGLQGRSETFLSNHQEACAEYTIAFDVKPYLMGREEGLKRYCHQDNGYRLGRSGAKYHYVCPEDLEPAFLETYQSGRQVYQQEQQVRELEKELERQEKELHEVELQAQRTEKRLISRGLSSAEREDLLFKLRAFEREQRTSYYQLQHLEHQLLQERSKLEYMD